ncbi:hypothetical protein FCL87_01585 [Mycoplasma bovis]|uniref:hypothetical protein n=1 Tax=Mycoplasmopsis bovis TaxID=28903 RepID=UPI001F2FE589|nr:hypothetical protein [Mycoplasmopsis bovis]MBT1328769.1 hypothetical protein [Mycoplasmopsis bovis]UJB28402.1 hypothetical protein FG866_02595 [Mycoplasmopsis bovis]
MKSKIYIIMFSCFMLKLGNVGPVIITPLMFLSTYIIKAIYIIKLNKHNRTALTFVSAFLVLFSYE